MITTPPKRGRVARQGLRRGGKEGEGVQKSPITRLLRGVVVVVASGPSCLVAHPTCATTSRSLCGGTGCWLHRHPDDGAWRGVKRRGAASYTTVDGTVPLQAQ